MKVTENEYKDRKHNKESCLQRDIAERKEYAEASAHLRITEKNHANTDFQRDNLRKTKGELLQKIRLGKYKPNPVRRVEIPKVTLVEIVGCEVYEARSR